MSASRVPIQVNGRTYKWPDRPLVVVCVDGCEPDYIHRAAASGAAPWLGSVLAGGTAHLADAVVPTFTNPNNLSIVTGAPPSVHGICGNYFYDPDAGVEVMMNDPKYLRADTILAAFARAGASLAVVTAKDKLRRLLGHGMRGHLFFLREGRRDDARRARPRRCAGAGRPAAALGLQRGPDRVRLRRRRAADGVDAAGHHVPVDHRLRAAQARARHAGGRRLLPMMDGYLAQLDALGATVALTADHGMNAKTDAARRPRSSYLQDRLDDWLGAARARVILPITDPYVVHHGALGSFATVYLPAGADAGRLGSGWPRCPGSRSSWTALRRAPGSSCRQTGWVIWS